MKAKIEPKHKVKGITHYGLKAKCVLCNQMAPMVMGNKTGGRW